LAGLLFFGPLLVLTFVIPEHPDFAYVCFRSRCSTRCRRCTAEAATTLGRKREADTDVAMFGFYIFNNVRIGFQTFAGGLAFGLGTIFYLLYNGVFIGCHHRPTSFTPGWPLSLSLLHIGAQRTRARRDLPVGRGGPQARLRPAGSRSAETFCGIAQGSGRDRPSSGGSGRNAAARRAVEAFWSPRTFLPAPVKYAVGGALWLLLCCISASRGAIVQLDQLSVVLRQRNPWEAIDLGFAMAREWWRDAYAALAGGIRAARGRRLLAAAPLWGFVLVWWFKPALDRINPARSSERGVRLTSPPAANTLRSFFSYARNGLIRSLLPPFRFSLPVRSICRSDSSRTPVAVPPGSAASSCHRRVMNQATWLTLMCLSFEAVVFLSLVGLYDLLVPAATQDSFNPFELFEGTPDHARDYVISALSKRDCV